MGECFAEVRAYLLNPAAILLRKKPPPDVLVQLFVPHTLTGGGKQAVRGGDAGRDASTFAHSAPQERPGPLRRAARAAAPRLCQHRGPLQTPRTKLL